MWVSFGLATVNLLLLITLFRTNAGPPAGLIAIPFAALTFSYRQKQNWLMGFQTAWFFMLMFLLLAVLFLKRSRPGWRPLILAGLMTSFCSYSYLPGLLAWLVMPLGLFMLGYRRWRHFLAWGVMGATATALFSVDYRIVENIGRDPSGQSILHPWAIARFVLAFLGGPFVPERPDSSTLATAVALLGLSLFVVNSIYLYLRTRDMSRLAVWVVMAVFTVATALLMSLGRLVLFLQTAQGPIVTRYVTMSTFLWFSVIALCVQATWWIQTRDPKPRRWKRYLAVANVALIAALAACYVVANRAEARQPWLVGPTEQRCVLAYMVTRETSCLRGVYPEPNVIPARIDALARLKLSLFKGR